ncbi:hypothetical protein ACHAWF_018061 [Thalassiosira exigua]
MKFGERLLSSQHPQWSGYYINYLRLKQLLIPLFDLEDEDPSQLMNPTSESDASPMHHYDGSAENGEPTFPIDSRVKTSQLFQEELNHEIQKALLFLMKSMGELASDLASLGDQKSFMAVVVQSMLDENVKLNGQQKTDEAPDSKIPTQQLRQVVQQQLRDVEQLRVEYLVRVGTKLLLLLDFVQLNIEAIVKIVKKHDKFLSRWEDSNGRHRLSIAFVDDESRYTRLRRQYLPRFAVRSSEPNVRCLFLAAADAGDCSGDIMSSGSQKSSDGNFGGWDVIQWNLEKALRELFQWEKDLSAVLKDCITEKAEEPTTPKESFAPLTSTSKSFSFAGNFIEGSPVKSFLARSSSFLQALSSPKVGNGASFFEPVLYQIQSSRQRLGQMHHRYIRMVYAHEMLHIIDDKTLQQEDAKLMRTSSTADTLEKIRKQSIDGEDKGKAWMEEYPTPKVSSLSKFLNLASAGYVDYSLFLLFERLNPAILTHSHNEISSLYMCNYNIVAPTSGLYAEHLGFDAANAGIIIGMTPMAVLGSSIVYSWWSSYSYKKAILFASFSCIVGNIVYALALPCQSLKMVLLGRLLTGFGSARVINRRYIADYYSIEDRTSGMATFVSASAVGMAVGPALAASLSFVAPVGHKHEHTAWTVETAPGYIMFVLWSIYIILNILFFEEPDRLDGATTKASKSSSKIQTKGGPQRALSSKEPSENSPLLASTAPNGKTPKEDAVSAKSFLSLRPLLRFFGNIPVLISIVLLMLLKAVLEGVSSSAPTLSHYYFSWGVHASGIYLALLASFVIPTNHVVAYISRRFDDRELILGTLVVMFFGILGFLVYGDGESYSETRYILFGLIMFVACNALEGPTMGLLSKTIPKSLARGIFNAGLLATEAGTMGRVIGDFWLSNAAFLGLDQMLNRTFEPMCTMVVVAIIATLWSYRRLQPRFEDEDDD